MRNFNHNKNYRKPGAYNVRPINQNMMQNMPVHKQNKEPASLAVPWTNAPRMICPYNGNPFLVGQTQQKLDPNTDWYALNNNQRSDIRWMMTSLNAHHIERQFGVFALPKVAYFAIDLPPGVLPMDPQLEVPQPRKSLQFVHQTGNEADAAKLDHFDMLPMTQEQVAPAQNNLHNVNFATYSIMTLTVNEALSQRPHNIVFNVIKVSPMYSMPPFHQQRLQAAIQQNNVPLTDALVPVIEGLYADYNNRYAPPTYGARSRCLNERVETFFKYTRHKVRLSDTVMALDRNGVYQPIPFSDWGQRSQYVGPWSYRR